MEPADAFPSTARFRGVVPGRVAAVAVVCLGLGLAAGCAPSNASLRKIAESEQIQLGGPERAGEWPYWPHSLRFLALSRSVPSPAVGGKSLELYVECLDAEGHTTKASGHLVLELTCPTAEPTSRRLTIDLSDLKTNRDRWDEVTSSYRLDVASPFERPPADKADIDCRVILFSTDGRTPTATMRVEW